MHPPFQLLDPNPLHVFACVEKPPIEILTMERKKAKHMGCGPRTEL